MRLRTPLAWAVALGFALAATEAQAVFLDLSQTNSGFVQSGLFFNFQSGAGTGQFNPFLTLDNVGGARDNDPNVQEGFNTDARPTFFPDADNTAARTRAVTFSAFAQATIDGVTYVQFGLDTNEPNTVADEKVDLVELQVFVNNDTSAAGATINTFPFPGTLTKVYDLDEGPDGDSAIRINDTNSSGSGTADIILNIPLASFIAANATPNSYLYLYAAFANTGTGGIDGGFSGGFEEFNTTPSIVPEPSSILLCCFGFGALGLWQAGKVRRKRANPTPEG